MAFVCATALRAQTNISQSPAATLPDADAYEFSESARTFAVPVVRADDDAVAISWPAIPPRAWDTAVLRAEIAADIAVTAPHLEVSSGALSDRQYFRPGDAGARWVDVSFLRESLSPGGTIRLRGAGISIASGTATLRVFDNRIDLTRSILVLAPHPDDAEIAAFGLYANRRSTIVTVTSGNAGAASYDAVFDAVPELYQFKGRIRTIDSVTIPWQGGIPPERTFNLGYFDARLAAMHDAPDSAIPEMYGSNTDVGIYRQYNLSSLLPKGRRLSTWSNLVRDLEQVLKRVKPSVIVAPHPQLDAHRDHQFTTVALAQALTRWRQSVTLLLFTNHADQNRYPYGPAGTLMSLPPALQQPVHVDRIYSHPVSPETQRMKLFAMESMHDLRLSPSRVYQIVRGDDRALQPETQDPGNDVSYFRRGQRSNELYFVYDRETFSSTVDAFLRLRQARPTSP